MSKTSGTVVIGCKFPNGLLLEIGRRGDPGYESVLLKGANEGTMQAETGIFLPRTECGFGRTTVSAAFWEKWSNGAGIRGVATEDRATKLTAEENTALLIANRKAWVKELQDKGILFVVDNTEASVVQAASNAAATTGLEPLSISGDARAKAEAPGVQKVA